MYATIAASVLLTHGMLMISARPVGYIDDVPIAICASPDGKGCFSSKFYGPQSLQYHSWNENGKNVFGYAYEGQAAYNVRNALGNQVGSWAYVNPEGKEINVAYVSDSDGYRVMSNDLPIAPTETPEVAALRAEHMAVHASIRSKTTPTLIVEENAISAEYVDPDYDEINAAQIEFMKVFREIQAL
ncbi:pupal cuticle protein Edg-78E-like [Daphnia carinata]|uniref:pupal cuticle protein Edg-78E-like n=1 Tax=Daphnia carinata TaxID=120202 RepID=UPI00257FED0B|nr:pupal cuticle protein Edg-78E-like [Daphnia carinata]